MAVEKKIKDKMRKWEYHMNLLEEIEDKIEELQNSLDDLLDLKEMVYEKLDQYEDYMIEHFADLKLVPIRLINDEVVEVLIAHQGTTTFAVLEGEVALAKLAEGDIYDSQAGELIATQKVINKVLARDYGMKLY